MNLTSREFWTALHGMALGAGFLLAFSGAFVALWGLRRSWLTDEGAGRLARQLSICTWSMTILAWATVVLGSYTIYPWYRAKLPAGTTPETASPALLAEHPKSLLIDKRNNTKEWHEFGMEWKEHIAWLTPILATAVAFVVTRYGRQLVHQAALRRALLILFTVSFLCAAVAGIFGALINKAAPTR